MDTLRSWLNTALLAIIVVLLTIQVTARTPIVNNCGERPVQPLDGSRVIRTVDCIAVEVIKTP